MNRSEQWRNILGHDDKESIVLFNKIYEELKDNPMQERILEALISRLFTERVAPLKPRKSFRGHSELMNALADAKMLTKYQSTWAYYMTTLLDHVETVEDNGAMHIISRPYGFIVNQEIINQLQILKNAGLDIQFRADCTYYPGHTIEIDISDCSLKNEN